MSDFNRREFMAALSGLVASFYAGGMPEDAIVVAGEDFFAEMEEESSSSESSTSIAHTCTCMGPSCPKYHTHSGGG
jgi:hypothetical protein